MTPRQQNKNGNNLWSGFLDSITFNLFHVLSLLFLASNTPLQYVHCFHSDKTLEFLERE